MLGSNNIPVQIKAVLILILGLIIQPFIDFPRVLPNQPSEYVLLIFSELLIGLVMGLVGRFMFAAIEFAGTVVGFQMVLTIPLKCALLYWSAAAPEPVTRHATKELVQFWNLDTTVIIGT